MIILVPINAESHEKTRVSIWPGLVMILILCLGFIETSEVSKSDSEFIKHLTELNDKNPQSKPLENYLSLRPLLKIAPSLSDWNAKKLLYANFVHGSLPHLVFNLIGAFAGASLCASFIPFLCTLSIFLLGGSLGLGLSLLVSNPLDQYIPHVGASAGIFAMMGAYYIYNFRFRTRYFFWFPTRRNLNIALKTSWFFFLDVILLELIFSLGQIFPGAYDGIDHTAHLFGFAAGMFLAGVIRFAQGWPSFIQTRSEFLHWKNLARKENRAKSPFEKWTEILDINPYNDVVKKILFQSVSVPNSRLSDPELNKTFQFLSPTFIRLFPQESANLVRTFLEPPKTLPDSWLSQVPYDSVLRISKALTAGTVRSRQASHRFLHSFLKQYCEAQKRIGKNPIKQDWLLRRIEAKLEDDPAYHKQSLS